MCLRKAINWYLVVLDYSNGWPPKKSIPTVCMSMYLLSCRSDVGPEVGFEAVGLIDAKLETIGVWAKATKDDKPAEVLEQFCDLVSAVLFASSPGLT